MGHRLSKIVTRTGDDGTTGLGDGSRVAKDTMRIEAMGSVDELNCAIGVLLSAHVPEQAVADCLVEVQHDLFDLGGELAVPGMQAIDEERVGWIEAQIEQFNRALPPLKEFILPGGGTAASAAHLARAISRRAERRCWELSRGEPLSAPLLQYLNRVSDLLFVLARVLARAERGSEILWNRQRKTPNEPA